MNKNQIKKTVENWVNNVVIDLNLCPFAQREFINKRVRFIVSKANNNEVLLMKLYEELTLLQHNAEIETTLLIHPNVLTDFEAYNQFLLLVDELLEQMDLSETFQVASFHPQYQFEGMKPDDVENYTNRSPYPILHLLREASLDIAIDQYPDTLNIPVRNSELMRKMGLEKMKSLLKSCHASF